MKKVSLGLALSLIVSGCTNDISGIRKKIIDKCPENCTIRIKDVTDFKWSQMYIFHYNVTDEQIQKVINVPYPHYKEFTERIIFMDSGKIVYHEDNSTNLESVDNGDVVFDLNDNPYGSFTPEEATFKVTKVVDNKDYYFLLKK